jgi:hypothetical protein
MLRKGQEGFRQGWGASYLIYIKIKNQKLSVVLNTKNSPKPIFKCKDYREVFKSDNGKDLKLKN